MAEMHNFGEGRSFWHRLAGFLVFILGGAFTLLTVYSFTATVRIVIQNPTLVTPYTALWDASQMEEALRGLGVPESFYAIYALGITLVFSLTFLACGWLILLRRKQDRFGMFLALLLLSWSNGVGVFISMPFAPWVEGINLYLGWFVWPGLFLLLYLFPSGHITPRWARWFAWGWVLFATYGLAASILGQLSDDIVYFLPFLFAILLVGVYAQVYRFRHASLVERQQIKLVVFSLILMAGYFIFSSLVLNFTGLDDPGQSRPTTALVLSMILSLAGYLAFMSIPVSIAVAVLRYRLWDIDVIIRRTLVYGALTATLGLVYFGSVVLLQSLLTAASRPLTAVDGPPSTVAIVISTLAIAALFTPLRRRIQNTIDRRFYRRKYNAEKALAAFGLTVREEVDMETLSRALLGVVEDTFQPEKVTLWLRETTERRPRTEGIGGRPSAVGGHE